ncbi:hypothetical protein [Amycolatopsis sp. H20-H5]|uniref:hypothetical protein n=1 Tax=Amycolatopsis sp. H20-H5 TaxID=3046309 RepID=UPI002DBFCE73|nr:hypothetical protein [Amycolatopsis sp. H20-H5]MEC3975782.1 hypothetical protein [Amycolatopsis sp. H20-H5]
MPLPVPDGVLDACGRERRLVVRTRERFIAVQQLRAEGLSLAAISRRLGRPAFDLDGLAARQQETLVEQPSRVNRLEHFW